VIGSAHRWLIDRSRATAKLAKEYTGSRDEGTLSAGSRHESSRLCVHRVPPAHKRRDPPTPLRIAPGGGRSARKGMFYNEPKQRRGALTSAAGRQTAFGWSARDPVGLTAAASRDPPSPPPPPGRRVDARVARRRRRSTTDWWRKCVESRMAQ
jgi:hypothetical protein